MVWCVARMMAPVRCHADRHRGIGAYAGRKRMGIDPIPPPNPPPSPQGGTPPTPTPPSPLVSETLVKIL